VKKQQVHRAPAGSSDPNRVSATAVTTPCRFGYDAVWCAAGHSKKKVAKASGEGEYEHMNDMIMQGKFWFTYRSEMIYI
jgi:hypothetical protein